MVNRWSTGYGVPLFGLHGVSFVRASEETFGTVVLDALEALGGKGNGCLLGEPTCRRPVLPGHALPRPAVHRPAPTRPWYVRVLDSTGQFNMGTIERFSSRRFTANKSDDR